jgi:sugar lactone lactonase YvrE
MYCLIQGLPRGKVYRYNPTTRETHLLLTGLFYSNGVAVSADDSYLVISETDRLRLIKYWLKGPKVRLTCAQEPDQVLQSCTGHTAQCDMHGGLTCSTQF